MLERDLMPWTGVGYRHISSQANRDVLDFRFVGLNADNRWNTTAEPSLYMAGDPGVVIAEWGRNFGHRRTEEIGEFSVERTVFRLTPRLNSVLDLRVSSVAAALGANDAPACFTDRSVAQTTATLVRATTSANAIIVPSIAFLDDLTRWNLVVFLDTLPTDASTWISRTEYVGPLRWR